MKGVGPCRAHKGAPGLEDVTGGRRDAAPFPFYVGLHQPGDSGHFDRACISIHRLERRKKPLACQDVFIDSGAFTKLEKHGHYPESPETYARQLHRLWSEGVVNITVASTQDYMCEPFMLTKTGMTVDQHQRLTVERYDAILSELNRLFSGEVPFEFLPVLQGFTVEEYLAHIDMYGDRLKHGMWVGVGSVCKRQGNVAVIEGILRAIHEKRPDLRLHGFGVKITALRSALVRRLLYSADSMAWSYAARISGRNGNDWREAAAFVSEVHNGRVEPEQTYLF